MQQNKKAEGCTASEKQMAIEALMHRGQQLHSQAIFELFAGIFARFGRGRQTQVLSMPTAREKAA